MLGRTSLRLAGLAAAGRRRISTDLIVTAGCVRRLKALRTAAKNDRLNLRIAVEGGGCSGFQYRFSVEDAPAQESDKQFVKDGVAILVDETSLELIRGATIDFQDELIRSAFAVVNNPMSESACGCGSSFAAKNFESNPAID